MVNVFVVGDVANNLVWREQKFAMIVGNHKAKLIFHRHYHLNMIQGVEAKIVDEMRVQIELRIVNFVVKIQYKQNSLRNSFQVERFFTAVTSDLTDIKQGGTTL